MPHRRDDRHPARRHRAHERFLIKRPQILQRPATAPHDQQIKKRLLRIDHWPLVNGYSAERTHACTVGKRIRIIHHPRQFSRGTVPLHLRRQHDHVPAPAAPDEYPQKILHRRPRRRSDKTHDQRHHRNRHLVLRREQPLLGQLALKRLELALQPPHSVLDDHPHDELVIAPRLIDGNLPINDHLHPVAQLHRLFGRVAAKHHRRNLRARVLK